MEFNICKVCGLKYDNYYPWGKDGNAPSHDICDCCGSEFGYEDNNINSVKTNRKKWIENGANWFKPENRPKDWSLEKQLQNISGKE